jgi:hypothetical protein
MEKKMEKIPLAKKTKSIFILVLLLSIPSFLIVPTVLSAIPDYDVNSDGACNILDILQISTHIGLSGPHGWIREDIDKNGRVQLMDMIQVSNHYGESGWFVDMARVKKLSIAYGNTLADTTNQAFIATHFDMVDGTSTYAAAVTNMKTINPEIKVINYYDAIVMQSYYSDWNYVNQFESWFVHDKNGNRVLGNDLNGYLMNPAPNLTPTQTYHSWSDYYTQKSQAFLQSNPQYDGIFADDVAYNLTSAGYLWNVPYSDFQTGVLPNWGTWMLQFIQNLQTALGSDIVMPNAWKYTQFCEDITGVHFWEGFVHGRSHDVTQTGYGEWYTLYAIDTLHHQAEQGNIISVLSGTKNADSNPTVAHQYMLFTLICFLFAVEDMDKSYYAWNFFNEDASHGWYPEMDHEFGNPVGEYYNVQGSIYARNFENATVVANISPSTTYTISIGGTSYQIGPRTGMIIP